MRLYARIKVSQRWIIYMNIAKNLTTIALLILNFTHLVVKRRGGISERGVEFRDKFVPHYPYILSRYCGTRTVTLLRKYKPPCSLHQNLRYC